MATITSAQSGAWSATATWVGGVVPQNSDAVTIAAAHDVLMDTDTSGFANGLQTITVTGGATPGMLYFKDGTSGYIKMASGYSIIGTLDTNRGRLLANSDGVWGNTGALSYAYKAVIELIGGGKVDCSALEVRLFCDEPTNKYVRMIGSTKLVVSSVDAGTDYLTFASPPPAAGTQVQILPAAGATLPAPLMEHQTYYTISNTGNTCKLAYASGQTWSVVDITTSGSGTFTLVDGFAAGSATVNVWEDVTTDPQWTNTSDHNRVLLTGILTQNIKQQNTIASAPGATSIVLTNVTASSSSPGARMYLTSRNVSVRAGAGNSYIFDHSTGSTYTGNVFNCEIINTNGNTGTGIANGKTHTFGGIIVGCVTGIYFHSSSTGWTIGGTIAGMTYATQGGIGLDFGADVVGCNHGCYTMTECNITGDIVGTSYAVSTCYSCVFTGNIIGTNSGLYGSSACKFRGESHNSYYLFNSCYGCSFSGTAYGPLVSGAYMDSSGFANEFTGTVYGFNYAIWASSNIIVAKGLTINTCQYPSYIQAQQGKMESYGVTLVNCQQPITVTSYTGDKPFIIYEYGGVDNSIYVAAAGGTIIHDIVEYPVGASYSYKFTHANAYYRLWTEWRIDRTCGNDISITVHGKNGATGRLERVTWALVDGTADPFGTGGSYLDSFVTADSTDWQSDTLTYTRTDDRPIFLRVWSKHGSGNDYAYFEQPTGGGSPTGGMAASPRISIIGGF